jgi:hypothetical protein
MKGRLGSLFRRSAVRSRASRASGAGLHLRPRDFVEARISSAIFFHHHAPDVGRPIGRFEGDLHLTPHEFEAARMATLDASDRSWPVQRR